MPSLSGRFVPPTGPIINIGVMPPGVFIPGAPMPSPLPTFAALIDTGPSITCISLSVAQAAHLQPINMRSMISATHSVAVNAYLADLILPFGTAGFILPNAQVMEFSPAGGSPFQILVGRDIIGRGVLTLSFDGHFTFSL